MAELLREASLTSDKYLVVEGPTDRAFYREWLLQSGFDLSRDRIFVETVENIEIDPVWIDENALPHGARSYVIAVARQAAHSKANVRCIADRDCGHHVDAHQLDQLWWTDFPALESYIFSAGGLDTVNRLVLGERLPPGANVVAKLGPVLRELYTVRMYNESLPAPNLSKGFDKAKSVKSFDVSKTVPPAVGAASSEYARPTADDPRHHAYGHDIAELLLFLFANEIKTQAKVPHKEALENAFRLCLLLSDGFSASELADKLLGWLAIR